MRLAMFVTAWVAVGLAAAPASAQDRASWTDGDAGTRRVLQLTAFSLSGLGYVATSVFKDRLASAECRWCDPPGLDRAVRDALVWDNPQTADTVSDYTGFWATPVFTLGITALSAWGDAGATESRLGRVLDDTLPVLEAVTFSQLLVQAVKFSVARQRPRAHYDSIPAEPFDEEANLSFFSGHATLTFSLATAAGMVAHRRGSDLEPVVWVVGMGLAATTSYLRIAGDQHYATDVLVGALFGTGMGILIPTLLHPDDDGDDENQPQQRGLRASGSVISYGGTF